MVQISLLITLQALFSTTKSATLPPDTGKFFYVDFDNLEKYGLHAVNVEISDHKYDLFVSTDQYSIGLISNNCRKSSCDVPKKY